MTETISKAGDVNVKRIEIVNSKGLVLNVTNQVVGVEIFEDLFSPFITGNFLLLDSIDISSCFPLMGEERVNIEINTPGMKGFSGQFYLYKMSDKDAYSDSASVYKLHFMSLEGIVDANRKLSKAFSGKISDIAYKLVRTEGLSSKKEFVFEETINSTKFISNFWSPTQCITYVMEDGLNKKGTPSYVFFENREGFVFTSLESLYQVQPIAKFIDDNYTRDQQENGKTVRNVVEEYSRISNLYIPEFFNYLDRIQSGFYASSLTSYDITTKKYTYRVFDAKTKKTTILNDNALASYGSNYRSDSFRIQVPKYYGNFNGYTDVTNADTIQQRISLLKQAEALKIQITVPGRTDYTVGRTVDIEVYKNAPVQSGDSNNTVLDKAVSGRYLISAIGHQITRTLHTCNMELIKDSILKGS